jgi:hypothetical protein
VTYEYRVVWRREHDKTRRRKLYQTLEAATKFARFIDRQTWEEIDDGYQEDILRDNLRRLGDAVDICIERRDVGEWE